MAATSATLVWNTADTPAAALSFTYTLQDGSAAAVTLTGVTAVVASGVTQCSAAIAVPAPGNHSYVLNAVSSMGAASSAPLSGTAPSIPSGLLIHLT